MGTKVDESEESFGGGQRIGDSVRLIVALGGPSNLSLEVVGLFIKKLDLLLRPGFDISLLGDSKKVSLCNKKSLSLLTMLKLYIVESRIEGCYVGARSGKLPVWYACVFLVLCIGSCNNQVFCREYS